jgi:NADH-quinone oxidoreductase E subunit
MSAVRAPRGEHQDAAQGAPPAGLSSEEFRRQADAICARYPNKRSALLPLMFLVQAAEGHVTEEGMREVARILELTPAQVLASTSFYSMLKRRPQGDYLISVCRNISCTHMGARKVIDAFRERLGIEPGETTPDGRFTLETAECLATCDGAPSLQVNYEDFYRVSPDDVADLVEGLGSGRGVTSERGASVRTHREVSYETATVGLRVPGTAGEQTARTIGGESPRADTAPGFRPRATGDVEGQGA